MERKVLASLFASLILDARSPNNATCPLDPSSFSLSFSLFGRKPASLSSIEDGSRTGSERRRGRERACGYVIITRRAEGLQSGCVFNFHE